jgi:hypothetical protein
MGKTSKSCMNCAHVYKGDGYNPFCSAKCAKEYDLYGEPTLADEVIKKPFREMVGVITCPHCRTKQNNDSVSTTCYKCRRSLQC